MNCTQISSLDRQSPQRLFHREKRHCTPIPRREQVSNTSSDISDANCARLREGPSQVVRAWTSHPKREKRWAVFPSTKVVGKGLESPPNLLPCKFGNMVREARACCVWQGFMALVEWWLGGEEGKKCESQVRELGLRNREKFGRHLGAESAAVSVSFFIAQAEIETKLCV